MRQWLKLFLCSFLVLWSIASSQNVTSDIENDRQTRQTRQDCCPCPNSPASPMGRTGELECPCLSRNADADASPSFLTPSVIRPNSRKNEKKEEPKPLLHPEVDLASSVLETLREATDEEYKEAVARDAERSLAEPDKSRDMTESGSKKVVTIIVNSKERNSVDDVVAEASHVQETRVPPLNGFSHHPLQTQQLHKEEQKDTNKNIFDDINRKFNDHDLGESMFDNSKAELKIKHNNYMTPINALSLSKNSLNDRQTNEENNQSLNNINNDCTEKTPQIIYNFKLKSNSSQSSPDVMQKLSNDVFKTQPIPKINVNDSPNIGASNKQDTSSRNSQTYNVQNNNFIPSLKKSLTDLQNFFNSRNVELFDPIKLATQLRDATKKNFLGLKRKPSSLTEFDPFPKNNKNVKDDNNMNEPDPSVNNINFTQKIINEFNTQKDPEPSASEHRQVTELRENSNEADFMVDFNTGRTRSKNMDYTPGIKSSTIDDEDEDDVESKSSEQEYYENDKSNAKFFSDKSKHDADISDDVEWSDLDSTLEEQDQKKHGEANVKDSVSLNDLQKLSDSLLNESLNRESKNSGKVKCGIEKIGDTSNTNIRESAKSSSHEEEETENKGILRDASDMGTHGKTCSTDMLLKNSDRQEMKVEASEPIANKLALPTLILPNDDILSSLHNIIVEPPSLFNSPQFDIFKSTPILNVNDIFNQPLPSLDELRFRISDILGISKRSDASSEIDFDVGNSNINPIVSELSKYKSNPLRNPSQDADFDFIQLRPLALSQPDQLKSKLPRYNLNSYKAKLAVPKSLEIKPLKLESTFKNEGGLLDASLNFGSDLIKSAKKSKSAKLPSKQSFLKERAQFGRFKQMRKDSPVFGIDTPLWSDDPLNTASKHFQSRAEKSMKKIQQTLDSSHKEQHNNNRNLFSDTLTRPQNLPTFKFSDIQEKLQSLHVDLNDRLSSLQRSIIEEPKWPTLVNPTINKINRRSKNAKLVTAKTETPSLFRREYQSNIMNRPSKVAKPTPHILRNTKLGSLQPRYSKELRTAASSISPQIVDIQSFNPTSSKSETDSETRNTLKDSNPLYTDYNTKIRRLLELIRKSRMDKLKSVIKPLGLSEVEVSFSTTSRPTTEKNDIYNSASLQRSMIYSKQKDIFTLGSKAKSSGDTTISPSEHVNIEAPLLNSLGGLRATEENPDTEFNRKQRPSTVETDKMIENPLDVITSQSRSQKLKVTNCEDMKNIDNRREADTNVLSFRESENTIKLSLNVENNKKLHFQPLGPGKNDSNKLNNAGSSVNRMENASFIAPVGRNAYIPKNLGTPPKKGSSLLARLRDAKRKINSVANSDTDLTWSPSNTVEVRFNKFRTSSEESSHKGPEAGRLKPPTLKYSKGPQTQSNLNTSRSKPPTLTNTNCEGMSETDFTRDANSVGEYGTDDFKNKERKINPAANSDTDLTWSPSNIVGDRFNKFRSSPEESSDKGAEVGRLKPPTLKYSKGPQTQSNLNTSRSKPPTLTNTNCEGMSETDFTRDANSVEEYGTDDFKNLSTPPKKGSSLLARLRDAKRKINSAANSDTDLTWSPSNTVEARFNKFRSSSEESSYKGPEVGRLKPPTLKYSKGPQTQSNVNTSRSKPPTLTNTNYEGMSETDFTRDANSVEEYGTDDFKNKERKINPAANSDTDLTWSPSNIVGDRFNKFRSSPEESSDKGAEVGRLKPPTLKYSKGPQTQSNLNTSRSKPPTLTNTNCEGMSETDFTRDANSVEEYGTDDFKNLSTPPKKGSSLLARLRDAKRKINSAANSDTDLTWSPSNTVEARFNKFRSSSEESSDKGPEVGRLKPPTLKYSKGPQTQSNVNTSRSKPPTLTNTNYEGMSETDFTRDANSVEEYGTDDITNNQIGTKASSLHFSDELRAADKNYDTTRNIRPPTVKNDKVSKTLNVTTSQSRPPTLTVTDCEGMKDTDFMREANSNPSTSEKELSINNRRSNPEVLITRNSYKPLKFVASHTRKNSLLPRLKDKERKINPAANLDTDLTWSPSNTVEARFNRLRTSPEESSDKDPEVGRLKPPTLKYSKGPQTQLNVNTSRSKPPTLTNTNYEGMSETDFTRDANSVEEYGTDDITNDQISIKATSLNFSGELRAVDENYDTARNIRPPTVKNDKVSKTINVTTSQSRPPTLTVSDCEGMKDTDYRN